MDIIESILNQAPNDVTRENVEELMIKHNNNTANVLSELWNVNQEITSNIVMDTSYDNKMRWHNVREICNAYEEEMHNFMQSRRK